MKILNYNLGKFSNHKALRFDVKYWNTVEHHNFDEYIRIKDKFDIITGSAQTQYYTSNKTDIPFVRISDMKLKGNIETDDIVYLNDDCELSNEKILKTDDIVIAMIGSTVGKVCSAKNVIKGTVSNNISILRKKVNDCDVSYYELLFQTNIYYNIFRNISSQKAQPNLSKYDVLNLTLPIIDKKRIQDILIEVEPLKEKINKLKKNKIIVKDIIDKIFSSYFNYSYTKFNELNSIKNQKKEFTSFSNNIDLRFSSKFHREAGSLVYSELEKNSIKIKKALNILSMTGKGISPQDFEDGLNCYYITMADISSWELDYENLKMVSKKYEKDNSMKKPKGERIPYSTKVEVGDILMMRSGEGGIGKVALVTKDINAIFSDFLIRFRFDKNRYLPEFCYYYMRSKYFQYLIEINKKGLGNNTNIFPNIINEFPIPNISLKEQENIVFEIDKNIEEQKKIEKEIEELQEQVLNIVEQDIKKLQK